MRFITRIPILLILLASYSGFSSANSVCASPKIGINLAGPEFAGKKLPGRLGVDYQFPNAISLMYFRSKGFNSVRLPIKWERLQPVLNGGLDNLYLYEIQKFLHKAQQYDMSVVLDLHNYGRYRGKIVGSPAVPNEAFYDIWRRIALALEDYPALLAYGLMNEPHNTNGFWFKVAQSGVDGVRSVDKTRAIYVAGEHWSNAHIWSRVNPRPFVKDPENNIAYEAHLYFDKDFSGRYKNASEVYNPNHVFRRLSSFVGWLDKYKVKGVIGEWGVPTKNTDWFPVVDSFIDLASEHCLDWYYWRGGPWADKYLLSLEPFKFVDRPLMVPLANKLKGH